MTDTVTVLRSLGIPATKTWFADGRVALDRPEGLKKAAAFFKHESVPVDNIHELSALLFQLESEQFATVIRGVRKEPLAAGATTLRNNATFPDAPHHWACLDVDQFYPVLWDPVLEPEGAIDEFITTRLPDAFQGASYHWQLSSSAGKAPEPGKEQSLKAHLWFWLDAPRTEAEMVAWVDGSRTPVDRAVFRKVQHHYIAAPVIQPGASCPVVKRSGFIEGVLGDEVPLVIESAWLTTARSYVDDGTERQFVDPTTKGGMLGAFCRAYPPTRVIDELLCDEFDYETDSTPGADGKIRLNWINGGGAGGGAFITPDGFAVNNTHNTAPKSNSRLNSFDLVRTYLFGHLDDGIEQSALDFMGPMDTPSAKAMTEFASQLPDVQLEMKLAAEEVLEARAKPEHSHGKDVLYGLLRDLGVDQFLEQEFDAAEFDRQLARVAFDGKTSKFTIMTPTGEVLLAARADLASVLRQRLGRIMKLGPLEALARAKAHAQEWNVTRTDAFVKDILGRCYGGMAEKAVAFRQFQTIALEVDLFADEGRMDKREDRLHLIAPHTPLTEGPVDPELLADYQTHWPRLGEYLELLVAARVAADRKAAHLWMHAESDWGKGFFLSALKRHGLVHETSADELERALSGSPVGMTLAGMRRVWVLAVDEFKGVTRELKQLSSELTFSPKNESSVTVPLYLKHFMSAEDVPSLASAETGVESQFANRFMYLRETGVLSTRPVFARDNDAYFTTVKNHVAVEVNRLVEEYRALGREAAAAKGSRVIREMHAKYALAKAVAGGAQTLEERLPEIAERFANDMIAAAQASGRKASGRADEQAHGNVFQKDGAWYMRRVQRALDMWLEDEFGKSEGGKVRYKARQILQLLGGNVSVTFKASERPAGVPRTVKCFQLAAVSEENTDTVLR